MALANVLTTGATAADSADVVVAATTRFVLKATVGPGYPDNACTVDVLVKDDTGQYFYMGTLDAFSSNFIDLAPGTYLFRRKAGVGAVGVFSAA